MLEAQFRGPPFGVVQPVLFKLSAKMRARSPGAHHGGMVLASDGAASESFSVPSPWD